MLIIALLQKKTLSRYFLLKYDIFESKIVVEIISVCNNGLALAKLLHRSCVHKYICYFLIFFFLIDFCKFHQ